jgi:hypothetical protein
MNSGSPEVKPRKTQISILRLSRTCITVGLGGRGEGGGVCIRPGLSTQALAAHFRLFHLDGKPLQVVDVEIRGTAARAPRLLMPVDPAFRRA